MRIGCIQRDLLLPKVINRPSLPSVPINNLLPQHSNYTIDPPSNSSLPLHLQYSQEQVLDYCNPLEHLPPPNYLKQETKIPKQLDRRSLRNATYRQIISPSAPKANCSGGKIGSIQVNGLESPQVNKLPENEPMNTSKQKLPNIGKSIISNEEVTQVGNGSIEQAVNNNKNVYDRTVIRQSRTKGIIESAEIGRKGNLRINKTYDVNKTKDSNEAKRHETKARKREDYKPYSLEDYRNIKPINYYRLGGLGPNIGGELWKYKQQNREKMIKYAKSASYINKKKGINNRSLSLKMRVVVSVADELRQRRMKMLEYAKHVPKPKLPKDLTTKETLNASEDNYLTELERLELQHNIYIQEVENIAHQF